MPRRNRGKTEVSEKGKSKYNNKKVSFDGYTFDSIREKNRYIELKDMLDRGIIQDLELQKRFDLYTPKLDLETKEVFGIEKDGWYVADFVYKINQFNQVVVEDVKGYRTKEYKKKRKRMKIQYGIEILET